MGVKESSAFSEAASERLIASARAIPLEVVQAKGHGHAGTAMSIAPLMHVLFSRVMRHDPARPEWEGRDRFVLSAGHASLALYVQLYLTGYGLDLDEIAAARSYGTRTPGHPEVEATPGVEMSTGPLGQGLASAVGLAAALRHKQALLDDNPLFDQTVWVVAGDGCLQEGVSSEACSLAGTLNLPNLVVIWDDNGITIDGDRRTSFREDTRARFRAYGWTVLDIDQPNNVTLINEVLQQARMAPGPVLVAYRSVIGWPSQARSGTSAAHAGPFGADDVAATKQLLGFLPDARLADLVPQDVLDSGREALAHGKKVRQEWEQDLHHQLSTNNDFASTYRAMHDHDARQAQALKVLEGVAGSLSQEPVATRVTNGEVIQKLAAVLPLWGGSADLAGSTSVALPGISFSAEDPKGIFWNFGIREHAMASILNGIALEGTWRPYGSTYMAFSDYLRPALRIGALMHLPTILVFTHDSVAVGEDGPTHQPVEQVSGMRMIPGVQVVRPADAAEVVGTWIRAVENPDGPLVLALSRQNLPSLDSDASLTGSQRGAYVAWQSGDGMDLALLASGSELGPALAVAQKLGGEGFAVRVISVPAMSWFDQQDIAYRDSVLPERLRRRIAIEAGSSGLWWKYVGLDGRVIGIDSFGASGPGNQILERKGISEANLEAVARELLG